MSTFEDGVLVTPDLKIEITESKVIPPGAEGNEDQTKPVIAFWYETTNLTNGDSDRRINPLAWIFHLRAEQDIDSNTLKTLVVASPPDPRFFAALREPIAPGDTAENVTAYVFEDETTPVEVVAFENDHGNREIGRTTHPLD